MTVLQAYENDPWITFKDVMRMLKVGRSTAFEIMHQIEHFQSKRCLRVRLSALMKRIEEHTKPGRNKKRSK